MVRSFTKIRINIKFLLNFSVAFHSKIYGNFKLTLQCSAIFKDTSAAATKFLLACHRIMHMFM